jgi:hypothetical protein
MFDRTSSKNSNSSSTSSCKYGTATLTKTTRVIKEDSSVIKHLELSLFVDGGYPIYLEDIMAVTTRTSLDLITLILGSLKNAC